MNDALSLLRELRPADPDSVPDEGVLERLLRAAPEAPEAPAPAQRSLARPAALVAATAAAATIAVAIVPSGPGDGSGVLARAAAALSRPETILHFRAIVTSAGEPPRTLESWQTTSGRQERIVYDDGALDVANDQDARTSMTFNRERNELIQHTDPGFFDAAHANPPGLANGSQGTAPSTVGDLPALIARALRGDDAGVRVVGNTEIRGIPVVEVRITGSIQVVDVPDGTTVYDPRGLATRPLTTIRDVYISREDSLPVRVVDHVDIAAAPALTVDYLQTNQLPTTPANEALLQMPAHPDAKQIDEGP